MDFSGNIESGFIYNFVKSTKNKSGLLTLSSALN